MPGYIAIVCNITDDFILVFRLKRKAYMGVILDFKPFVHIGIDKKRKKSSGIFAACTELMFDRHHARYAQHLPYLLENYL